MAKYTEDEGGSGGGKYISLLEGCLVLKSDTEQEGYEEYNTTNPSTKQPVKYYIKQFKGGVEGRITRLERVELEANNVFGWNLHMEDEEGDFSIYFREGKTTTERLLKMFESIDLEKDVRIKVWKDENGYPAITMTQEGKNVPQFWNKENLPQPKKIKGKWNYDNVSEFLYNNAMEKILPQFADAQAEADAKKTERAEAAAAGAETAPEATTGEANTEDIPF
jgi:hypothetical protein